MQFVKTVILALFMAVTMFGPAEAANCSIAKYQSLANQAARIQGPANRCASLMKRNSQNMAQICRVCGPVAVRLLRFERNLRNNKRCFSDDRSMMRTIAEFGTIRDELQFVRRGCGY